jgi:hypothetical protein
MSCGFSLFHHPNKYQLDSALGIPESNGVNPVSSTQNSLQERLGLKWLASHTDCVTGRLVDCANLVIDHPMEVCHPGTHP